nr:DUF6262 family protein [Streptomyces lunaelactis]
MLRGPRAAAVGSGEEVSVSAIARAARVDRSFLYRHRDLLERIHAAAAAPSPASEARAVTRASLQADLANALERNSRLTLRVRQLERRLSESSSGPPSTSTSCNDRSPLSNSK